MGAIVVAPSTDMQTVDGRYQLATGNAGVGNAVEEFLSTYRAADTVRAYRRDLKEFFGGSPALGGTFERFPDQAVGEFLGWPVPSIRREVSFFKTRLLRDGKAEATVNRSLSAVTSLCKWAYGLNLCETDGRGLVDKERTVAYRDTRGVDLPTLLRLVEAPLARFDALKKPPTAHGIEVDLKCVRDLALLRVLCENGLRRAEVHKMDVRDFSFTQKRIAILGKGKGTQKEWVSIRQQTAELVQAYLVAAGHDQQLDAPVFKSCDHRPHKQNRLGKDGIHKVVRFYGVMIGEPLLSPHKLRHSAITALAKATNGNVVRVKSFSRHKKTDTVMIYIDNAMDAQGEMTNMLGDLIDAASSI